MKQINKFERNGKIPFDERFEQIKDHRAKARIAMRIDLIAKGNAGDYKQPKEFAQWKNLIQYLMIQPTI